MGLPPLRANAGEPPTYDFGDGRRYAYHDAENHRLVLAFGAGTPICAGAPLAIDAEDEMFRMLYFAHGENRGAALAIYFSSGLAIWQACSALLRWRFGGTDRAGAANTRDLDSSIASMGSTSMDSAPSMGSASMGSNSMRSASMGSNAMGWASTLLDFACGHGRVTRFAVHELGAGRVSAAEIEPSAVTFVGRELGVAAHQSTAEAAAFEPGARYDAILVSSLFTHLPRPAFAAWLARLAALLAGDGMLILTLHDLSILPPGTQPPADGFEFRASSESRSLPGERYGTTWVSESTARELLRAALPQAAVHRLPRAGGGLQDLYVVVSGTQPAVPPPAPPPAAASHIDMASLSTGGRLTVMGWCADRRGSEPPRAVVVRGAAGTLATTMDLEPRPAAAALFPFERLDARGFHVEADLPGGNTLESQPLSLVAICQDGAEALLYRGTVAGLLLLSARLDLEATGHALEAARAAGDRERGRADALEAERAAQRQAPRTARGRLRAMLGGK